MESPVVLDKPPEYHGNERGFPFEDEEGSGAWSELAARHPDIAARLRQRPATATWARKRRPSSQDATDDFGENFSGFDSFPFDDIPPEFREHFPSHWNRRFGPREEQTPKPEPENQPPPQQTQPQNSPPAAPQQNTAATQTELDSAEPAASAEPPPGPLPQYGLRNTVDLGQASPAEPGLDAEERAARSMSAPPPEMSAPPPSEHGTVRHIPIFVEGRDEPVINRHEPRQPPAQPQPPPQPQAPPHVDRDQYFADDGPASFHHPPNFARAFGTPFNKGFRQGSQPFTQQKAFPQSAFARGASPARAPPEPAPARREPEPPAPQQPTPAAEPAPHQSQPAAEPAPQQPPPPAKPSPNDPISQILGIQTDVLNLMTEVENFTGTKKDKRYMFLDEMLTRNLIKLDNIETDGKENIRLARKEAIRCIQKCIAVLEAKAEKGGAPDVAMKDNNVAPSAPPDNGEEEMKETQNGDEAQPQEPPSTDQRTEPSNEKTEEQIVEDKPSPKIKVAKKRDKSKDKAPAASAEAKDSNNKVEGSIEVMQVDNKGEMNASEQVMEVDGAASQ